MAHVTLIKPIGYGGFGSIELVHYRNKLYAHKKCPNHDYTKRNSVLLEAIRLTDVTEYHPNIQQLYYINLDSLGFFMDYCHNGSLDQVIERHDFKYELIDALNWSYQLADALSFLHGKNISNFTYECEYKEILISFIWFFIVHRDVKVQNMLLKHDYQTVVLADFGTATELGRDLLTNKVGTLGM